MILAMFLEIGLFLLRDTRATSHADHMRIQAQAAARKTLANQRTVEAKMDAYAQSVKQRKSKNKSKSKRKQQVESSGDEED